MHVLVKFTFLFYRKERSIQNFSIDFSGLHLFENQCQTSQIDTCLSVFRAYDGVVLVEYPETKIPSQLNGKGFDYLLKFNRFL